MTPGFTAELALDRRFGSSRPQLAAIDQANLSQAGYGSDPHHAKQTVSTCVAKGWCVSGFAAGTAAVTTRCKGFGAEHLRDADICPDTSLTQMGPDDPGTGWIVFYKNKENHDTRFYC